MYFSVFAVAVVIAPAFVISAPTSVLNPRDAPDCGKHSVIKKDSYTVHSDQGDQATGTQCTHIISLKDSSLSWSTTWSWSGSGNSESAPSEVHYLLSAKKITLYHEQNTTAHEILGSLLSTV